MGYYTTYWLSATRNDDDASDAIKALVDENEIKSTITKRRMGGRYSHSSLYRKT